MSSKKRFYSIFIRGWFTARMAVQGILSNTFRSSLTILGVAIGVASVVSLMGIGEGARRTVVEQFESLGTNVISIKAYHSSVEFDPGYIDELMERVDGLKALTPVVHSKAMMSWRRTRSNVEVIGVNGDFPSIRDHQLLIGNFFGDLHVKNRLPVAVLGYNIARSMSGRQSVVGSTVALGDKTYRIIGILAPKGEGKADDIDNKIVIPYTLAQTIEGKRTVEEIWGKAESRKHTDLAVVQLSRIIKRKLGLDLKAPTGASMTPGDENIFSPDGSEMEKEVSAGMIERHMMDGDGGPGFELPQSGEDLVTITNLNQLVEEAVLVLSPYSLFHLSFPESFSVYLYLP